MYGSAYPERANDQQEQSPDVLHDEISNKEAEYDELANEKDQYDELPNEGVQCEMHNYVNDFRVEQIQLTSTPEAQANNFHQQLISCRGKRYYVIAVKSIRSIL